MQSDGRQASGMQILMAPPACAGAQQVAPPPPQSSLVVQPPILQGTHIVLDAGGNPIVSAQFTTTFDTGAGNFISRGEWDLVVAKYSSSDGSVLWTHTALAGPASIRQTRSRCSRIAT
ncbi:MAG: hypothetical protein R3B07_20145 [Polyangiaceae bacterium]